MTGAVDAAPAPRGVDARRIAVALVGAGLTACAVGFVVAPKGGLGQPWVWVLTLICAVTALSPAAVSARFDLDASFLPLALAALYGPAPAALAALIAELIRWRRDRYRAFAALANLMSSAIPTMALACFLERDAAVGAPELITFVAGCLLALLLNVLLLFPSMALYDRLPLSSQFGRLRDLVPTVILQASMAATCLALWVSVGPASAVFVVVGATTSSYLTRLVLEARRHVERAEALAEARRVLARDLEAAEQHVRARVATELHDQVVQTLLAARQDLKDVDRGHHDRASSALRAIDQAIEGLRRTAVDLHPAGLEHTGLQTSLERLLADQGARAGFTWELEVMDPPSGVAEATVWGVSRELILNAAKHSGATGVKVKVGRQGDATLVTVSDDGRGIESARPAQAIHQGHIGLLSWSHRLEALGGSLKLEAAKGKGTRACARVPSAS